MTKCRFCNQDISFNYDIPGPNGKSYTIWDTNLERPHDCKNDPAKKKRNNTDWMIAGKDYDPKWRGVRICWLCGCNHDIEDMLFFNGIPPCITVPDAYKQTLC